MYPLPIESRGCLPTVLDLDLILIFYEMQIKIYMPFSAYIYWLQRLSNCFRFAKDWKNFLASHKISIAGDHLLHTLRNACCTQIPCRQVQPIWNCVRWQLKKFSATECWISRGSSLDLFNVFHKIIRFIWQKRWTFQIY